MCFEQASKRLARYQTTAEQQIEEQRMRFKKIASVAASRVEQMRDLLIRWKHRSICTSVLLIFKPVQMGRDEQLQREGCARLPAPHPVPKMLRNIFQLIVAGPCFVQYSS